MSAEYDKPIFNGTTETIYYAVPSEQTNKYNLTSPARFCGGIGFILAEKILIDVDFENIKIA